eukprot:gene11471-biopygen4996
MCQHIRMARLTRPPGRRATESMAISPPRTLRMRITASPQKGMRHPTCLIDIWCVDKQIPKRGSRQCRRRRRLIRWRTPRRRVCRVCVGIRH